MNWNELKDTDQLEEIKSLSKNKPVLIFKHSTRCPISSMALNRLERKWKETDIEPYFLDLIRYRDISAKVEQGFRVVHQSPQAILIRNEMPVYDSSHSSIDFDEIDAVARGEALA